MIRRRAQLVRTLIVPLGALIVCAGCEEHAQPVAAKKADFIAFIGPVEDDPLWPLMRATAEHYRDGLTDLDLVARAPSTRSADEQIRIIRELEGKALRGLCIEPVDPQVLRDVICKLQTDGVVVVAMMQRIECEDPLPFAGVDEMAVGGAIAEALRRAVGGPGTVAVMTDSTAGQRVSDRTLGFRERMRLETDLKVLREFDCKGDTAESERIVREYMERFPRLDAWASLDNWPLRNLNVERPLLPSSCRMVTTTPLPEYWPRIRDRTCAALVGVKYERIAESALGMCAALVQREPLQTWTYLAPPVTVTEHNLNWYRVNWFEMCKRPEGAESDDAASPDATP